MNSNSRTKNSVKNSLVGVLSQVINIVLSFVVRTVFIKKLGADYLGVNGLYTNILTMLSVAELGVGSTIIYNMYKPIANNDELQVTKLMNFYKNAYHLIGVIVAIIGVSLVPFLDYIIKDKPDVPNLTFIYLLFLSNTVLSYFFAYKRSIFTADQRDRVIKRFDVGFYVVKTFLQIVLLMLFNSYLLYLITQIVCTCGENISISLYADKSYPFMKKYKQNHLTKEEKKPIFDNIKSVFVYKIGSAALNGTDNIIISAVDGVKSVGLLSNYTLITASVQMFLDVINGAITGSVGNYIAKEDSSKHEGLLDNITFINFLMYGIIFVGSIAVLNPFIELWIGKQYLLDISIIFVLCLNMYLYGTVSSVWTFRAAMGLFKYGRWRPLISAAINLVVSIWWGNEIGLIGVLFGTTFTRFVTNVCYDPCVVYKYGLHKSTKKYYIKWVLYLVIVLIDIFAVICLQKTVNLSGILAILIYGCFSVVVFVLSVFLCCSRTSEFKYVVNSLKRIIKRNL